MSVKTKQLLSTLAIVLSSSAMADLVAFGKQCLADERKLANDLMTLTNKEDEQHQKDQQIISQSQNLATLMTEIETLTIDLEDCQQQGNSNHCYQLRSAISHLKGLSQNLEKELQALQSDTLNGPINTLTRDRFNQKMRQFIAQCRDSNQHYAFLNSPNAYRQVCIEQNAKQTITCTFQ